MPGQQADAMQGETIGITIYVEGGCVQAVYTTLPKTCDVDIELLDFDNARGSGKPGAIEEARERLKTVEKEQRVIF